MPPGGAEDRVDVLVVGAGIVGLATAWRLLGQRPGLDVLVVDKADRVGGQQSSHNSGVLHAGIYYAPGSLKARLCREGKAAMEAFAREHGIPFEHNGKVVVARDRTELPALDELWRRTVANEVPGARRLDATGLREVEPHVAGIAAIHSPTTGVIDFGRVCEVLARKVVARGCRIGLGASLEALAERPDGVVAVVGGRELRARVVVACVGVQSDRVAALDGGRDEERIVPFRGSWVELTGPSAALVRGNVYPVPDPRLPFLGVHATRRVDGRVLAGPNAVLALHREGYRRRWQVDARDARDALGFPGLWRLGRRHWRSGLAELWREVVVPAYVRELRRYLPEVRSRDVVRGPWGIRAQALRADGTLVEDFRLDGTPRVLHVRNAPSPAATSSLAIGRLVAEEVVVRLV